MPELSSSSSLRSSWRCAYFTPPPLSLQHEHDGPQGVANGNRDVTCWPAALTVVQTWDPELMYKFGAAMGREQYLKGSNVMLGPGVNLARLPWNGRNL